MVAKQNSKVAVVGLGEIGKPVLELVSRHHDAVGVDISPVERIEQVDIVHVCYPFEIKDFIGETARYIELFKPRVTVINSTVAVGTTRSVAQRTGAALANSPVRGKHVRMLEELRAYTKFIGPTDPATGKHAAEHFEGAGLKTRILSAPEATEVAKLTETTYFGLLIAWAQEVERYCDRVGQAYGEIGAFYEEIPFFPATKYFPGIIGGHCVMPNIEILRQFDDSSLLQAIQASNRAKIDREARKKQGDPKVEATRSRG